MRTLTELERIEIAKQTQTVCINFQPHVGAVTAFHRLYDGLIVRVHVSIKPDRELDAMASKFFKLPPSDSAEASQAGGA